MSDLPEGFVPAFTFIRTEDGTVEYVHPAGEALTRGGWDYTLGRYASEPACGEAKPGSNVSCTRAKDHEGSHVAAVAWTSWWTQQSDSSEAGEPRG